jgi:hypothetical protein
MVGADGSDLFSVTAFAASLQSAGQLVGSGALQDRRRAEGSRRDRPVGGEAGGRRVVELGRELGGQYEGPSLRREHALPASLVLGKDRAVGRGADERGESVGHTLVLASLIDGVCRGDALLEPNQRGRIVWSRSGKSEQVGQPAAVGGEHRCRGPAGSSLEEVASSHGPVRVDVERRQPKQLGRDVKVAGQPFQSAYVMDAGSAVLDP